MKDNPFRKAKIHGYHRVKQDNTENLLTSIPHIGFYLIMLRVAVVGVMLAIAEYSPDIKGLLDFVYHFTDDVAWLTVGVFLIIFHKKRIGYSFFMHLERISLIAFILSCLNIAASIAYGIIEALMHYWLGAYYVLQVVIWIIMACFFYNYWKHLKQKHKHSSEQ